MLEDGTFGSDFLLPSLGADTILGDVAARIGTVSSESPDDSRNPPSEATATGCAAQKTTADAAKGWADQHEDRSEASSSTWGKDLDEAPKEPCDEALVYVSDLGCFGSGGRRLIREDCLLTICVKSVPGFLIWVVERVYAQIDNKDYGQD